MAEPTADDAQDYQDKLQAIRAAQAAGRDTAELELELREFMSAKGMGEGGYIPTD